MTYTSTCTCGDKMSVEAASKEEALSKLKDMMSEDAIAKHMAEKHPGAPVPSVEQAHAGIEQSLVESA